jgi:hypothetical protein
MMLQGGSDDDPPNPEASEQEDILASLDQDLNPIAPDGNAQTPPKQAEFNEELEDHVLGTPAVAPTEEKQEADDEVSSVDEGDWLKNRNYEGKFNSVDEVADALDRLSQTHEALGELLRKKGYQVSDNPAQDLVDALEREAVEGLGVSPRAEAPSHPLLGDPTPPPAQPQPPAQEPEQPRSYEHTANLLAKYPGAKLTPEFLKLFALAANEYLPKEASSAKSGVSWEEIQRGMVPVMQRLFRDRLISDHIADRVASGEKIPPQYRDRLRKAMEDNPTLVERAWRGYLIRGRHNGIMEDYARNILATKDEKGLSGAETAALAEEQRRAAAEKKTLQGGSPPAAKGKKKAPTIRELEVMIEREGKKIL